MRFVKNLVASRRINLVFRQHPSCRSASCRKWTAGAIATVLKGRPTTADRKLTMKKLMFALPLAAAMLAASCVKVTNENGFKADNTATMKMTVGYKLDAVEGLKGLIAQFGGGEDESEDGPTAQIDKALESFDEKKIVEQLKKSGIEVTKSATVEKDGWKLVEMEGAVKDVNAWIKKSKEATEEGKKEAAGEGMPNLPISALPLHFYKTDKPDVAKFVIVPPLGDLLPEGADEGLDQIENLDDEQREQIETMINMVRSQISLDEMRVEMKCKLPGKILSAKGCKQEGDDTMVFSMKGGDLGLDGVKNLFGLKEGVYVTFQFDPKEMKITLEDEPKATDSKPAVKEEAKPAKKDEEEKKKGGEDG